MATADDAVPDIRNSDQLSELLEEEDEQVFEIDKEGCIFVVEGKKGPDDTATPGRSGVRAQFTRNRTHNEQIIVAPCGTIIARVTFYGAEAISGVAVRACSLVLLASCTDLTASGVYQVGICARLSSRPYILRQ